MDWESPGVRSIITSQDERWWPWPGIKGRGKRVQGSSEYKPLKEAESIISSAPADGTRALWEALGVGAFVLVAYLLLRISPYLTLGALPDDGIYIALGRALANGDGYRSIYAVGDPVHAKYPPGLPLLYAAFWRVAGDLDRVHALGILSSTLASATAAGVLWWTGRVRYSAAIAPLAVLAIGAFFIETSVQYLNLAVAEAWFLAGWASALALFPWAMKERGERALILGLVLGVTALFRSQALFLIPAFGLAAWWTTGKLPRAGKLLAGAALPVGIWRIWHGLLLRAGPGTTQPDEAPYGSWLPTGGIGESIEYFASVVRYNTLGYTTFLPDHLSRPAYLGWAVLGLLMAQVALATWRRGKEMSVLWLSLLAQVGLLALWPFAQDRFYVPLLPLLGLLAASSFGWGNGDRSRRVWGVILILVVAVVGVRQARIRAGTFVPGDQTVSYHASRYLVDSALWLFAAGAWIQQNTTPDDRILAPLAPSLFLYPGRKTVNARPAEPNVGSTLFDPPGSFLAQRVVDDKVTVVILPESDFGISLDVLAVQRRCPGILELLESVDAPVKMAAYRIQPDDCLRGFLIK